MAAAPGAFRRNVFADGMVARAGVREQEENSLDRNRQRTAGDRKVFLC